jgi:hypothetical protein
MKIGNESVEALTVRKEERREIMTGARVVNDQRR